MIIKLKGADFSNNNINALLNNWFISLSLGSGATSSNPATSIAKGAEYRSTITIADGYELGAAGITVTMGGTDITAIAVSGLAISISAVTGNVVIKIPTVNISTGEEEDPVIPTNYTFTINPTPSNATVTLTASGYAQSGNSITVPSGTSVNWSVSATGYSTQSGTQVVTSTSSKNITLSASEEPTPVVGWFSNQIEQPALSTTIDLTSAPYGYTDELCASYYNKPVNKIRLKVATPGIISFGVCSADRKSIVSTYTINVVTGTDEYDIPETFTLAEGQGIWWQTKTDTGKSYCTIQANDKLGTFYSKVGTNSLVQPHNNNYSLGFDLGYFE